MAATATPAPATAPAPSASSADRRRLALARRLTERDRAIARAVAHHRVLTTDHLEEAFFDSRKRAWARLGDLYRMGVLERFTPYRPGWGSLPLHFVLGRLGAVVVAAEEGRDPIGAARRWRAERALAIAHRQYLPHLLAVNALWACLAGHARRSGGAAELVAWLTEPQAAAWTLGLARPDAALHWREGGADVDALLEYDRGTEALRVLAAKLPGYERLEEESGRASWVLFAFSSARREANARAALAAATVPVATAVVGPETVMRDPIWLPLRTAGARLALAALAGAPKPPEALGRSALGGPRSWRFARPDLREEGAEADPTTR